MLPTGPVAATTKTEDIDGGPREVPELEIRERPPPTLRNIDGGPPGGARAGDPGA
jgi:hypothetical protein